MSKSTLKYILKRIGYALLTILVLVIITFIMMHIAPGNPFSTGKAISDEAMAALEAQYGLDKPMIMQILIYIKNAFMGNFGESIKYGREVSAIIADSFPFSFELGMRSLIIAVFGGIGIGSLAAVRRGKASDTVAMGVAVFGVSVPSFIVAALLQYFLSLKLGQALGTQLFPITGWTTEASKILPAIALALGPLAQISRLMRTSMLDVLNSDYIKTAKAKGLSQAMIIWRHALRNACMPVLTVLGPIAASILTGGFVVEQVFSIPGMGRYFVNSIKDMDYYMISGTTIFYGAFLIFAVLIVDVLYGVVDPRVNIAGSKE